MLEDTSLSVSALKFGCGPAGLIGLGVSIGGLITRTGFWGPLYCIYSKELPK